MKAAGMNRGYQIVGGAAASPAVPGDGVGEVPKRNMHTTLREPPLQQR